MIYGGADLFTEYILTFPEPERTMAEASSLMHMVLAGIKGVLAT
jgi:hypothetical protein